MTRLVACFGAIVLFAIPLLVTIPAALVVAGVMALLVAVVGIVTYHPRAVTVAACAFLGIYTAALLVAGAPVDLAGAVGEGLALLLMMQGAELSRSARRATVNETVLRSQAVGWTVFGASTVVAAGLVMLVAQAVAGAIPFAAAPLIAALGALGVVLALVLRPL